jgi:hypothetical protein
MRGWSPKEEFDTVEGEKLKRVGFQLDPIENVKQCMS